jgi:acyl-CoA thioesterase
LLELRDGYSKLAMTTTSEMANFHNVAHDDAIFALADAAFVVASNSHDQTALALSMNINHRLPAKEGTRPIAEAFEESLSNRTSLYRKVVRSDDGTLIASSLGAVYRKIREQI